MSQISPPLRILLAGSILFLAAWFVLLRPGGGESEPAAPPSGQVAPAPGQTAAQTPATVSAAPATSAGTAVAAAAPVAEVKGTAALAKAGIPADVARHIDKRVVVLAFVNRDAADDRRVAGAMRKVYKHQGKVFARTANIENISKYAAITRGADVQQSATVIVVDRHRDVASLVGFVDSTSINQAVVDALLVDGRPVDDSPYLQKLEGTCGDLSDRIRDLRDPRNLKEFRAYLSSLSSIIDRFYPRIRNVKAPKRYRGLHRQLMSLLNADERLFNRIEQYVRTGQMQPSLVDAELRSLERDSRRLDLRLAGLGMEDCR